MKCAWQQLLSVLPKSVGQALGEEESEILQELRLRVGQPPELICKGGRGTLSNEVTQEDVNFVINAALSLLLTWVSAKTITPLTNLTCNKVSALLQKHTPKRNT